MDKTKLLNMLATKRSTFDSLYKKMEKLPDTLECGILWNIVHPWIWNIVLYNLAMYTKGIHGRVSINTPDQSLIDQDCF